MSREQIVDYRAKALSDMLREAGHVLRADGYSSFSGQIDSLLVNYGFDGLQCEPTPPKAEVTV